jgi:hypothetical protein
MISGILKMGSIESWSLKKFISTSTFLAETMGGVQISTYLVVHIPNSTIRLSWFLLKLDHMGMFSAYLWYPDSLVSFYTSSSL